MRWTFEIFCSRGVVGVGVFLGIVNSLIEVACGFSVVYGVVGVVVVVNNNNKLFFVLGSWWLHVSVAFGVNIRVRDGNSVLVKVFLVVVFWRDVGVSLEPVDVSDVVVLVRLVVLLHLVVAALVVGTVIMTIILLGIVMVISSLRGGLQVYALGLVFVVVYNS